MATKKTTTGAKKTTTGTTRKTAAGAGGTKAKTTRKNPTSEEIRKKAEELYLERVSKGEHGSAEEDWIKAEKLLKGSK